MAVEIILASASPRRQALLAQINVKPIVMPVDVDETPRPGENPLAYVQRLAAEKSARCLELCQSNLPILAADTSVVLEGKIYGKPENKDHAMAMLGELSGKTHQVYTAISLRSTKHDQSLSITDVAFRLLQPAEIAAYWQSGEPVDKAGGYAIQGLGAAFVTSIAGSYSGVMGLPLFETAQLLTKQGFDLLA